MNIQELYKIYEKNNVISTDSRKITPGCLFFALKGESFNGNEFAQKAIEQGAGYAIIDQPEYAINDKFIIVRDVLKCLQELANFHRKKLKIPIIAITGTNGKTTTKELINAVLSKKFKTFATQGNFNNHIGVPLTLLSMNKQTQIGVVEMGANHIGEIKQLCEIALPDYGLITNIGTAHIEGFGSAEGVLTAKTEMYRHLISNQKEIFVNFNNSVLVKHSQNGKQIGYGTSAGLYCSGKIEKSNPFLSLKWTIMHTSHKEIDWKNYPVLQTNLIGGYNLDNCLAAICIGSFFGVPDKLINEALEQYSPSNNRSQLFKSEKNTLLLDMYNANPSSMEAAIKNFAIMEMDSKIMILGDMFELGNISEQEHTRIAQLAIQQNFESIIFVGDRFKQILHDNIKYKIFDNADQCAQWLTENKPENKTILIKGSRGVKLEKLVPFL